jgi:predicted phage-related endonuclease
MKILNLIQGSDEWLAARLNYLGGSEAPMMMGDSKFMSRGQLLDLKKGWQANPNPYFLEKLFAKGHDHEEMAREVTELEYCEDFPPIVGLTDVGLSVPLISSYDGLNCDNLVWEHKDWNLILAANVKNGILEAQYYWQLEHQMLVADANEVLFTCSDGGDENRISMLYISVPERREALIKGWKQFLADLETHQLEAKSESIVAEVEKSSFPTFQVSFQDGKIVSNINEYVPQLKMLADEQMSTLLESDQDFADKEAFNKRVKKGRADLKAICANIKAEYVSLAEFNSFAEQADSILQKLQSHGDTQVKNEKIRKKDAIVDAAKTALSDHLEQLSKSICDYRITVAPIDWVAVMKNKRLVSSMQESANLALAKAKIEAVEIAELVQMNQASMSELASEHFFLFSDVNSLLLKQNEDFVNLVKYRINVHEQAEAKKLEDQRIQLEKEAAEKAEADRETIRQEEAEKLKAEQDAELAEAVVEQPIAKTVETPQKQTVATASIAKPRRPRPFAMPTHAKVTLSSQQKINFHDFLEANWDGYEAALIQFNNQKAA